MTHQRTVLLTTLLVSTVAVSACGSDPVPVAATIEIAPLSGTIAPGETLQLTATAKDTANVVLAVTFTWLSHNTLAATVSSTGLVTAVANGSANITATADGKSGSAAIVVQLVASVDMTPANTSVRLGSVIQLIATPRNASGGALTAIPVNWSSDNTGVATVNTTGVVSGIANGTALITAEAEGTTGVAAITVWTGVTGTWTASFDLSGGTCALTLSLTEDSEGDFTGTGVLSQLPCFVVPVTFVGMNNTGAVPDSVTFTLSAPPRQDVLFNGKFDGVGTITGALSGGIVSPNLLATRTSFTPMAPPAAAPAGTSGAYSVYARPEENR